MLEESQSLIFLQQKVSEEPQDIMIPLKHTRLAGATFENDEQFELAATSPATSEYHSAVDEVGRGDQESDIPAEANLVFESAGSPLDDSNNKATSEVSKSRDLPGLLNLTVESRNYLILSRFTLCARDM